MCLEISNENKQSRYFNRHLSHGFKNDSYFMTNYDTDCVNILNISN